LWSHPFDTFSTYQVLFRRQTYAAEEAVQKLEKQQAAGDGLILRLKEQMRAADADLAALEAGRSNCRHHTEATAELIGQADAAAEAVRKERKALVGQWQASLAALGGADAAMQVRRGGVLHWTPLVLAAGGTVRRT